MLEKRAHRWTALMLALLLLLAPAAMAASPQTGASPDAINWGKLGAYLECAVCVYMAVDSAGAATGLAVVVCARAWIDYPD